MSERLNIKRMTEDSNPERTFFDPARDISQAERRDFAEQREIARHELLLHAFTILTILELQLGGNVKVTKEEHSTIVGHLEANLKEKEWFGVPDLAVFELQLGRNVQISGEGRQAIADEREKARSEEEWGQFAYLGMLELQMGGDVSVSHEEREAIADQREQQRFRKNWDEFGVFVIFEILLQKREQSTPPDGEKDATLPQSRNF